MKGNIAKCDLTPTSPSYSYLETMRNLMNDYLFEKLSEGGFGIILGNDSCVVKLLKDASRCDEMTKEQQIYNKIEEQRFHMKNFLGKIPRFHIFSQLTDFCHLEIK